MNISTPEDPYAFLSSFDTIFVIEDPGSITSPLWLKVQNVLHAITSYTSDSGKDRADKAAGSYYGICDAKTV
ncbi:hypothetical protein ColTof4_14427 [Colletotrichum tofieldiae]|nr:hypothetical protein ColTof4_14427 [Colletotrichum tofieldiae]